MRKYVSLLLLLCMVCFVCASCSISEAPPSASADADDPQAQEAAAAVKPVDVDLTAMSSTMVYAEVYNIMTNPKEYRGKTIKMRGPYYATYYDETGLFYHYVVIQDASACCQQGLEFVWTGDHAYPEDYPEDQTQIEVVGVYKGYKELGETYYHLVVNDISIL